MFFLRFCALVTSKLQSLVCAKAKTRPICSLHTFVSLLGINKHSTQGVRLWHLTTDLGSGILYGNNKRANITTRSLTFEISDEGHRLDGVPCVGIRLYNVILHHTDHAETRLVT